MKRADAARAAALVALVGCGTPDRGAVYSRAFAGAEAAETGQRFADAARLYDEAAAGAKIARDAAHARYLAARALERAGDRADAAERLRAIAYASPSFEDSAEAALALGEMQIAGGDRDDLAGWAVMEDVARRFPSSGVARRALLLRIRHEDDRAGERAGLALVDRLTPPFRGTELEDALSYERALHLAALGYDGPARDAFLDTANRWPYPHGGYWDDSLYRASVLDEKLGRYVEAMRDLTRMLSERESSFLVGSYERPRYEPAKVRLCALYRDRLRARDKARECFHELYTDFSHSELRDDALWEESRLFLEGGDAASACARLTTLVLEFPTSRYAPCAAAECPALARAASDAGAPPSCHPYLARSRLGDQPAP